MSMNAIGANMLAAHAASQSSSTSNTAAADPLASDAGNLFLKLLVAQLKTQDPTSPMDPTQMVGQMLSMNQLNELIQIRQLMQTVTQPPATKSTGA
jgi:flagellar basal-body rod modification protein FlgD